MEPLAAANAALENGRAPLRIGVIGATGVVGGMILRVLEERDVPVGTLLAYASRDRADGIGFRGETLPVFGATRDRLANDALDVAFFASSDDASAELAHALVDAGAVVIDNSSTFRLASGVPLIVPEVNPDAIGPDDRIFPVANCTAIVLTVGIAPIERAVGLRSVRVATYQAVSGAGRAGIDALAREERGDAPDGTFAAPIFRNVVPQVGSYDGDGDTGEELKVAAETRKMLGRPDLVIAATTVRVPVMRAHSEAVFLETARATSVAELHDALRDAPGVVLHERGIVTPRDVEDTDLVHVARVRPETGDTTGTRFQLWVVGDQLRKGAATNGVQILELLLRSNHVTLSSACLEPVERSKGERASRDSLTLRQAQGDNGTHAGESRRDNGTHAGESRGDNGTHAGESRGDDGTHAGESRDVAGDRA